MQIVPRGQDRLFYELEEAGAEKARHARAAAVNIHCPSAGRFNLPNGTPVGKIRLPYKAIP